MDATWHEAIERFGVETAPPELHLTHSLLNSFGPTTFAEMELLDDPVAAQAWVDDVLDEWRERHPGAEVPAIPLTASARRSLKSLRASVRDQFGGAGGSDR